MVSLHNSIIVFFFNDTATTEIYTLSLHDALPISTSASTPVLQALGAVVDYGERTILQGLDLAVNAGEIDRKSTRLNSSHVRISYAVFCLKKKTARLNRVTQAMWLGNLEGRRTEHQ